MDWLNIHRSTLSAEQFLGCDPVQRATWLCLMAYCADQENGGKIEGASDWGDRKWQQVVRVTKEEALDKCALWAWENGILTVWAYPVEKELEVKRNRENGGKGGRPTKPRENQVVSSGLTQTITQTEPSAPISAETERKGIGIGIGIGMEAENEGKERGEDRVTAQPLDQGKDKASRFIPPTEDQWTEYCLRTWLDWHEAKIRESHAYYQSVGWFSGKTKLKDWKSAAKTAHGKAEQWGTLQPFGSIHRKQIPSQRTGLPIC